MSEETLDILENGTLDDIDVLIFEIKEAINDRSDTEDVIALLEDNGIILEEEQGIPKICKKKHPE
jgi:hypothetical protein